MMASMLNVSIENQDTCAVIRHNPSWDHRPHRHTFLFPVVCHSPRVVGSPPQTGSCNPPLEPLRLEGHGLYLCKEKKNDVAKSTTLRCAFAFEGNNAQYKKKGL